ncbi:MAG: hypothetical protein EWV81_17410 [Microcystis aeruginosa Ma_SC_T_19800800_S464]|uniref:Calx-beta domain-containing protein n=1 Tax=Microcystis aeruginosa Ma_SC_T_19800800_S464 TaxID=2486257 RepID=A0A552DL11_MICAE|nr:MAG: hypothetical protein EWV81_17410 [Microcystis aeruginosa Ma_SC_T_19800800_S464]
MATMIIDGQLTAVEQSNPTPALVASYQGLRNARDVRVIGNYAYLADFSSTTADLKIVNISTPAAPVLVGQSNATNVISDVDFSNGYVYAADGTSGLRVIDVSNPSSPNLKSTYNSPGDAQDVKIVGNYAYVADGKSGLQIVNISNPNSPVIQGNAPAPDDVTGVKGSVSGVDIVGNYAYIISYLRQSGFGELQIFNISNPNSPVKLGESTFSISTQDILYSVQVAGNYAYVATGSRGLKIIDISNPISPTLKGEYFGSRSASAEDVQVVGNYAYVAYGVAGLDIIDISNPSSPILAASYAPVTEAYGPFGIVQKVTNYVTSVEVVNNYAYLTVQAAKDLGGLWILDVNQFTGTNQPPSVGLVVSPASVTEDGTQNLIYTFTRSGSTTNALTVNYTLGGTATLNTDYTRTGTTNTVTFAGGSSTATVTVDPTADTIVESNETVILTLAAGTGYTIGTPNAVTGTINNDDSTVTSQLSINNITVVEGKDNNATLTVTVNNPNPQPISVNYTTAPVNATANVDYTSKTGTLTIAANTSTATISIPILNDNLNEANETFAINLSNPVNATLTNNKGIVTISDTLTANVTTTLTANVENLTLTGTTNINGTGNAANNILTGNSGKNTLTGSAGNDTLNQSSVTYTLGNNLENLTLTGTANINGTGNTLNNIITGNSGNNILNGGTGIDTLIGQSSVTYTLGNNLENLTLTGTANINGTGNTLNNIITGNSGKNTLTGSAGNDTLIGGTGNDTITGGAGSDRFTFNNRNEGIDTITDFLSSQGDKIAVSAAGFGGGLAAGVAITTAQFVLGTTALNASNRLIYNTITGGLFFDGDGTGTIAAIQIATLSSKPTLTASDIVVLV